MRRFLITLLVTFVGMSASAALVVVDLSHSHTVDDLKRSGLRIKEIAGGLHGQAYSFQNQEVEIRLPAGRSITQTMVLGTIDSKQNQLTRLSMYGGVMPHRQAVQVMRAFHESFGLSINQFNQWEIQNRSKVRNAEPYSVSTNLKSYPSISLGIDVSMNGLYPWVLDLEVSWDWKKQSGWNEERAWRELPPPATGAISLNPPSGANYERRDAYKEVLEEQAKFEEQASPQTPAPATPVPTATSARSSRTDATAETSAPVVEHGAPVWPWAVGGIVLVIIAAIASRCRT